jgi:hypothetical protein
MHPAACAGPNATNARHAATDARHRKANPVMTPPAIPSVPACFPLNGIAIRKSHQGGDDGNQRRYAFFSDRFEFRTVAGILSQAGLDLERAIPLSGKNAIRAYRLRALPLWVPCGMIAPKFEAASNAARHTGRPR